MDTLVLGCGNKPKHNAINHDLYGHREEVDIVWDLNQLPWPWQDESFGQVIAESVLEHLYHNLLISLDALWRITVPNGNAVIKLPYWQAEISWEDPTHIHKAALGTFDQLDPTTPRGQQYNFYTRRKWEIVHCKLNADWTSIHWELVKRELDWEGH